MSPNHKIAKIELCLHAEKHFDLEEFTGTTLRGAFGIVLKNEVCIHSNPLKRNCNNCLLKNNCAYTFIFETQTLKDASAFKNISNPPHPFVIRAPFDVQKGQKELDVQLILIGSGIQYLPYFVHVFQKIGENGLGKARCKFQVKRITASNSEETAEIYSDTEKVLQNQFPLYDLARVLTEKISGKLPNTLSINFDTPTRIKEKGKLIDKLEFQIIIKNILRRLSLLSQSYCDFQFELDYKELISSAENVKITENNTQWREYSRFSQRQKTGMSFGGIVGETRFTGDFGQFWNILIIGSMIHIGKNSSFGFGHFTVKKEENE